jgi:toxin HigB-1
MVPIRSFGDADTERFYPSGKIPKGVGWANVRKVVARKLDMVSYATQLEDLKSPPGNRLEALSGDLSGFHSIRVNDQWRLYSGGRRLVRLKSRFAIITEDESYDPEE